MATIDQDIKAVKTMLEVLLKTIKEDSMIEWVSEVAVGKNNGGAYLSMYQSPRKDGTFLKGRFCTCYDQDWGRLPPAIVEEAKKRLTKARTSKAVNDREEDRAQGLAWEIDPIKTIRFRIPGDDKELWRYYAHVATMVRPQGAKTTPQPTPPAAEPKAKATQATLPEGVAEEAPLFVSKEAAIQYGVDQGAFKTIASATAEFEGLKERVAKKYKPFKFSHMCVEWINCVKTFKQAVSSGALREA